MKKLSALALALCLAAGATVALFGCGGKTEEKEFLKEYDASSVTAERTDGEDIYAGEALFTPMKMTNGENTLNYRLYTPFDLDEDNPKPLLLFMHGAGERGGDNERQVSAYNGLDNLLKDGSPLLDYIIIAPQCPPGETWMSFPEGVSHEDGIYSVDTAKPGTRCLRLLRWLSTITRNPSS